MGAVFNTASWDNCHISGHKLVAQSEESGQWGTFYLTPTAIEFPRQLLFLNYALQALARDFAIDGHTTMFCQVLTADWVNRSIANYLNSRKQAGRAR